MPINKIAISQVNYDNLIEYIFFLFIGTTS